MAISAVVSAADFSVTSDRKSTEEILTDNFINNMLLKEPDVDSMLGSGKNVQQELFFDFKFFEL